MGVVVADVSYHSGNNRDNLGYHVRSRHTNSSVLSVLVGWMFEGSRYVVVGRTTVQGLQDWNRHHAQARVPGDP